MSPDEFYAVEGPSDDELLARAAHLQAQTACHLCALRSLVTELEAMAPTTSDNPADDEEAIR